MTPIQIKAVTDSFATVRANPELATDIFYSQLFARAPQLRPMFPEDLTAQKAKLFTALKLAVSALDKPEALLPVLAELGAKHAGYGVQADHYSDVGFALIDTLAVALGDGFTPAHEEAWTAAYSFIAEAMQAGAARRAA